MVKELSALIRAPMKSSMGRHTTPFEVAAEFPEDSSKVQKTLHGI